jgi:nucleoside 2-deoxyribosyltransferase
MADPGMITDQIEDAIETASAIVADITGLNPNVMWELGYASQCAKPLVVLNQKPGSSPFDEHNIRQVPYTETLTAEDENKIHRHLRAALRMALGSAAPAWLDKAGSLGRLYKVPPNLA